MEQVDLNRIYPGATPENTEQDQPPETNEDLKKDKAIRTVSSCGKMCLVVGIITAIAFVGPSLLATFANTPNGNGSNQNYSLFGLVVFAPVMGGYMIALMMGPIVCGFLLLVSIINVVKYKIRPLSCLRRAIIGTILSQSFWLLALLLH